MKVCDVYTYGICLILFISGLFSASAQKVTGTVFGDDEGGKQVLPGVNIHWQDTRKGTSTGENGEFEIDRVGGKENLVFSFVGYETNVVRVVSDDPLEVVLQPNLEIEEVLVVEKDRGSYMSTIDPLHTEKITGAELHKAACCNLAESFETNPSVDVSYNDAVTGAKQIRLLGLDGTYTQLQTDNIPNFRGLATVFGLTYIPGPWMESIQVSKGAASVVNGYESVTGQINVAFKKPDSEEKLHLNGFADADGKLELNANSNIRVYKDLVTTGLFLHAENLSSRIDHNHDGFLDHPMTKQVHLYNTWKLNNRKGLMVHGSVRYLNDGRNGGQTHIIREVPQEEQNAYKTEILNNLTEGVFKIGNVWPSGHVALAFLGSVVSHDMNSHYGLTGYDAKEERSYANLVLTVDLDDRSRHLLNTGISYFRDYFREKLENREMERTESVPGVFAEYTLKPSEKLTLMTGIRTDSHNFFGTFVTPRAHFRYQPVPGYTIRFSAGKGFRTANVLAENNYLLSGARKLDFDEAVREEAWNYGASLISGHTVWGNDLQISAEFYRTVFQQHLMVDKETSAETILLKQSDEKSFANSYQVDLRYRMFRNLDLTMAYRYNDVRETIGGKLVEKLYTSRYKGLLSLNYTTRLKKWMFDYTVQFNGGGRLPDLKRITAGNVTESLPLEFPSYTVMNAQVTRYFRYWNFYAGSENLTGFMQDHPVLGAGNPFGKGFDATNIWGPVMGRRIYAGVRFTLNYNN